MLNKRGQLGEGITWFVATIIIIVVLIIFIFVVNLIAQVKSIANFEDEVKKNEENRIYYKSTLAMQINNDNEDKILEWISNEGN